MHKIGDDKKISLCVVEPVQWKLENVNVFNNSQINNLEYIAFKCFIYFNKILLKEVLECQAIESTL